MSDVDQGFFSQEQLVALSSFANDNFNDGTITFTRVYQRFAELQCTKLLLTPLTIHGRRIKEFPILFHVIGRLYRDECTISTFRAPGSTQDNVSIKLCIQRLPEVISQAEWIQCALALQSLDALAILETRKYIDTTELFCNDGDPETGDVRLFVHGLQAKSDSKQVLESDVSNASVSAGTTSALPLPNSEIGNPTMRGPKDDSCDNPPVIPLSSNPSLATIAKETLPALSTEAEYLAFDVTDRCIKLTDLSQLSEDVPVRVTFSLMLVQSNLEHTLSLRAKLLKLTFLQALV